MNIISTCRCCHKEVMQEKIGHITVGWRRGEVVSCGEQPKWTQGHWMDGWIGRACLDGSWPARTLCWICAEHAVLFEHVCRALVQKFIVRSSRVLDCLWPSLKWSLCPSISDLIFLILTAFNFPSVYKGHIVHFLRSKDLSQTEMFS